MGIASLARCRPCHRRQSSPSETSRFRRSANPPNAPCRLPLSPRPCSKHEVGFHLNWQTLELCSLSQIGDTSETRSTDLWCYHPLLYPTQSQDIFHHISLQGAPHLDSGCSIRLTFRYSNPPRPILDISTGIHIAAPHDRFYRFSWIQSFIMGSPLGPSQAPLHPLPGSGHTCSRGNTGP